MHYIMFSVCSVNFVISCICVYVHVYTQICVYMARISTHTYGIYVSMHVREIEMGKRMREEKGANL